MSVNEIVNITKAKPETKKNLTYDCTNYAHGGNMISHRYFMNTLKPQLEFYLKKLKFSAIEQFLCHFATTLISRSSDHIKQEEWICWVGTFFCNNPQIFPKLFFFILSVLMNTNLSHVCFLSCHFQSCLGKTSLLNHGERNSAYVSSKARLQ